MAYYYRWRVGDGGNSPSRRFDGSGCGNEIADNRPMVRKFIVDSVLWWQREYNIDGFRFDLMSLHENETIRRLTEELRKQAPSLGIDPDGVIV